MPQSILVIPDVHQNVPWVEAILEKELPRIQQIVFLGDYFDAKIPNPTPPLEAAKFFNELPQRIEQTVTYLAGNHDLPYLYDQQSGSLPLNPEDNPYRNNAYSPSISAELIHQWRLELKPFVFSEGFILSHAGIHSSYLPRENESGLSRLRSKLGQQLKALPQHPDDALAAVGQSRGGTALQGGITWLDWRYEFEDDLPWPQIVGHTRHSSPQCKGRSWNIDTGGQHYAILEGGEVSIESIP